LNTNNNIINNNIYLLLLNKYKKNPPENFNQKLKKISEIKNSLDYQKLSLEEQEKLFVDLMSYKGG